MGISSRYSSSESKSLRHGGASVLLLHYQDNSKGLQKDERHKMFRLLQMEDGGQIVSLRFSPSSRVLQLSECDLIFGCWCQLQRFWMHRRLMSLTIISSCESFPSPLGEFAVLEWTPESVTCRVSIFTVTAEIFLVPEPPAEARWNIALEG